jgi:predicted nucleotidyltransferase
MGFICNFSELIVSTELTSYDVNKLVNLMAKATEVIQARLFQPWLKSPFIYRLLGFKKTEDNVVSTTTAFMKEVGLQDLPCSIL